MSKKCTVSALSEVKIECEDSPWIQQEPGNDGLTDLCLEVEEEVPAIELSEDESTEDDWESFAEISRASHGTQYWPDRRFHVVENADGRASNWVSGNEHLWHDQLSSMKSQAEENNNAEYDALINIKIEDDSLYIEPHTVSNTMEQDSMYATEAYTNAELIVPEKIKQEVKEIAENEMFGNHCITKGSSQPPRFADYHLRDKTAIDYKALNSNKGVHPVCLTRSTNAQSAKLSGHRKNKKEVKTSPAVQTVESCLVCNACCVITENRKIPSLPFCRRCKKAYFYQLSHRYTSDNVYKNKECTAGGICRIDYRQKKNCPKCHHKKFIGVLEKTERIFWQPFKASKSSGFKSLKVANDQKQSLSAIREEILIQEAQTCQPVVLMERLDADAILDLQFSRFRDSLSLIKQEPYDVKDPTERIVNSCLQPMDEVTAGSNNGLLISSKLPKTFVKNPSLLVAYPTSCFKNPEVSTGCILPNKGHGNKKIPSFPRKMLTKFETPKIDGHFTKCREDRVFKYSTATKIDRPCTISPGHIKYRSLATPKRGRTHNKHHERFRAENESDTSIEVSAANVGMSNTSPVNHSSNLWSTANPVGNFHIVSTQNTSRNSVVEHSPFKGGQGRPTLKSQSLQRKRNKLAAVSILTCGHVCSKCNSTETNKWFEEHGYAVNPPLSFSINNNEHMFEEGSSSNSALVFQKLYEINQLLQGSSQFYFDTTTGVLKFRTEAKNIQAVPSPSPYSRILQTVIDHPAQPPPVALAAPAQPAILLIPPLQSSGMPLSSVQSLLIPVPCSSQSFVFPLNNATANDAQL